MSVNCDISFLPEKIKGLFCNDEGYQTPKVDTQAVIFSDGKILLVCENGKWSMPGGWCEFNLSPADNIVKETKERRSAADNEINILDWTFALRWWYLFRTGINTIFNHMHMVW